MTSTADLPALYPIVSFGSASTASQNAQQAVTLAQVLLGVNAALLQLRYKGPERSRFRDCAISILEEKRKLGSGTKIIINDDVELAQEVGADGVHLGQQDASTEYARELLGAEAVVGLSTHTVEQVESAALTSADYLGFGPIFESKTKSGHADLCGYQQLQRASQSSSKPIVAIGGITRESVQKIFEHGAESAAVISDLHSDPLGSENIARLIKWYETARTRATASL